MRKSYSRVSITCEWRRPTHRSNLFRVMLMHEKLEYEIRLIRLSLFSSRYLIKTMLCECCIYCVYTIFALHLAKDMCSMVKRQRQARNECFPPLSLSNMNMHFTRSFFRERLAHIRRAPPGGTIICLPPKLS